MRGVSSFRRIGVDGRLEATRIAILERGRFGCKQMQWHRLLPISLPEKLLTWSDISSDLKNLIISRGIIPDGASVAPYNERH